MRTYFEPTFLARNTTPFARLVVVAIGNEEHVSRSHVTPPTTQEVVAWYSNKYPDAHLTFLPTSDNKYPDKFFSSSDAYARGILHVETLLKENKISSKEDPMVLLTSINVSFTPVAMQACLLRTQPAINNATEQEQLSDHHVFQPTSHIIPQLYQPIPFTIYSDVQSGSVTVTKSENFVPIPKSYVKSDYGFWNIGTITDEETELIAPLCGRISDLVNPSRAALESYTKGPRLTFRKALYDRIYERLLMLNRLPDSNFVNIPSS